ncbi:hypothetical protein ACH4TE_32525 [Streptomyces sioyaensis]|uniref:hypothetical protein n=1 Tax=Streptomyces sioyaensis TaxID=67364 RepID=UPI0037BDCD29
MSTQTGQTRSPAPSQSTEYHYVTTVQTREGVHNTRDGVLTVPAGFTRAACFGHLLQQLKDDYGTPISVLFFALEPNAL